MKTDVYTKVVLTIIAACLVVIVVRDMDFVPTAHAARTSGDVTDVRIVGYSGYGNIPVEIKSSRDPLKVNIAGSDWGFVLPVRVESPKPLPVRMDR